jgi:hypothetical protein
VEYCPTGEMLEAFFTKPLQGALFRKFRDQIMKCDPSNTRSQDHRRVLGSEGQKDDVDRLAAKNEGSKSNANVVEDGTTAAIK